MDQRLTVLFLHGFSQTGESWDPVVSFLDQTRYHTLTPDLRGHGTQSELRPITFEVCCQDLSVLLEQETPALVVGYSLGGRIALQFAFRFPQLVGGLVLISTTAGIENGRECAVRANADDKLAAELADSSIDVFIERWSNQLLFADDPPAVKTQANRYRRCQHPTDLAVALSGLSVGRMQSLWGQLSTFSFPTAVLAGQRDQKFAQIAGRLGEGLSNTWVEIVPGCGHSLHLEAPKQVAKAIKIVAASI